MWNLRFLCILCLLASALSFLSAQTMFTDENTEEDKKSEPVEEIPLYYQLPKDHPGYGLQYHQKDFNYWRSLSDEELEQDPDAERCYQDYKNGAYDEQAKEVGVLEENLRVVYSSEGGFETVDFLSVTDTDHDDNFLLIIGTSCALLLILVIALAARKKLPR